MVPPGFLVDTRWLKAQGIDAKSIHDYVARGWLERIMRGVYRRPQPQAGPTDRNVSWDRALLSLQWILKYEVHLGGVSALDLAGHAHYLHLGGTPRVHLYGDVPTWLKRLPSDTDMVVHRRALFGDDQTGIIDDGRNTSEIGPAIDTWRWPLKASSSERAVLEALDELSSEASFEQLDRIFESLTTLRPKQLMTLLGVCRSVKVRRLFFVFADRHQHAWRKHLSVDKIDLGSGPRALVHGGRLHPTYRIYVPKRFMPAKDSEAEADA